MLAGSVTAVECGHIPGSQIYVPNMICDVKWLQPTFMKWKISDFTHWQARQTIYCEIFWHVFTEYIFVLNPACVFPMCSLSIFLYSLTGLTNYLP